MGCLRLSERTRVNTRRPEPKVFTADCPARALKRTHWLYEPDSFVPAAQLVEAYNRHAQRMTGTGHAAYSSTVSTGTATSEPQLYYIHTDHLGTPQELTDRDGNLQWTGHYRAWGELAKANDSEGNAANVEMPLRFQGQYCDAETGLHYNRHRYYDPQLGRFTSQDPISLAGGLTCISMHLIPCSGLIFLV